jgi:hypothetical protein
LPGELDRYPELLARLGTAELGAVAHRCRQSWSLVLVGDEPLIRGALRQQAE